MTKKNVIIILSKKDRKEQSDKVDEHAAHMLLTMRKDKGFTQEYMAGRSGLSLAQYRLYEEARSCMKLWNVDAFSKILGISPIRFFLPEFQTDSLLVDVANQAATLIEHLEAVVKKTKRIEATCRKGVGKQQPKEGKKQ